MSETIRFTLDGIEVEQWRRHGNTVKPHSAPGSRVLAPENIVSLDQRPVMH